MRMLCYKCNHSWNYKGKNTEGKGYITCSGCYYKIRIDKALVEDLSQQELLANLPKKRHLPIKLPTKLPSFKAEIPTTHYPPRPIKTEKEQEPIIKMFNNLSDFNMEVLDKGYQEEELTIRKLPLGPEIINVISYDPIKHLEHQRSFF